MATRLFEPGDPNVLYLIDLSGYVFRSYHAVPPLSSTKGEPTHATLGTVNMLERLVRVCRPAMLAVAMDSSRGTNLRKQIYPEYKANRPPQPDDLRHQMGRCHEIISAFNVPVWIQEGIEADDLIASAVERAHSHKMKVCIVSADKDLMQLVGDDVIMWDTMRNRVFGLEEVENRFGVGPEKLRDMLALMGDTSDNIPGVPSVGPKTARDLLLAHDTLEGIYEALDTIKRKKLRETLTEHKANAFLSRDLVTLKRDCELDFERAALRYGGRDLARLRELYTDLEFERHLDALDREERYAAAGQNMGGAKPVDPEPPPDAIEVRLETLCRADQLEELVAAAQRAGRLAIHVEGVRPQVPSDGPIIGVGLAVEAGVGYYVPLAHRGLDLPSQPSMEEFQRIVGPVLRDSSIKKVGHRLRTDEVFLTRHELELRGHAFDVELAGYLIDPESPHGVEALAKRELDVDIPRYDKLVKPSRGKGITFDQVNVGDAAGYAGACAEVCLRLWDRLGPRIDDEEMTEVHDELELPLLSVLAEMETRGVLVDMDTLSTLGRELEQQLIELERKAHDIAGRKFNVHSPKQLETLLFDDLKLKPLKRTKTGRSTDAATLEALASAHPLPAIVLEARQLQKLKGTYIDALPALRNKQTGRVHTRWRQTVAATGRISSSDPNLQNIPVRTELGRKIRSAFVAPEGHQLVSGDYSQIELRVLAHLSKDPVLVEAFNEAQDIHTRTAMEVFDLASADDVTAEHRRRAKAVNFGVIYGQGEIGLAKSLGIDRNEAALFIRTYFQRYVGVRRFLDETLEHARHSGAVRTMLGRRRILADIHSANRQKRFGAERIAMNTPIQGSAADILKLAMLALSEPVTPGSRMILTVHDELVFEVPDAEVEEAKAAVRQAMESVYTLDVPLVVDVGSGPSWTTAH